MTAMDQEAEPEEPMGIFKLPPELRARIWDFYFEDTSQFGAELDLCEAHEHLPRAAITTVCTEIREETLSRYKAATATFWQTHSFVVVVGGTIPEEEIMARIMALRSRPRLQSLSFTVKWRTGWADTTILAANSPALGLRWYALKTHEISMDPGEVLSFTDYLNDRMTYNLNARLPLAIIKRRCLDGHLCPIITALCTPELELDFVQCVEFVCEVVKPPETTVWIEKPVSVVQTNAA